MKIVQKLLPVIFALSAFITNAQVQVAKIIGKNANDFSLGYGAFLKVSHPVSDGSDVSFEAGVNFFALKEDNTYGWGTVPLKVGYRYTLNQKGTGIYVEPQVGYNVVGVDPDDNKFTGFVYAASVGYLFQPLGRIQFDLGLHFESALHTGGAANFIGLRLTHNFTIGRRDEN